FSDAYSTANMPFIVRSSAHVHITYVPRFASLASRDLLGAESLKLQDVKALSNLDLYYACTSSSPITITAVRDTAVLTTISAMRLLLRGLVRCRRHCRRLGRWHLLRGLVQLSVH